MTHSIRTRVEGEQYDENSSVQVASAVMQPGERRERRDNRHKCWHRDTIRYCDSNALSNARYGEELEETYAQSAYDKDLRGEKGAKEGGGKLSTQNVHVSTMRGGDYHHEVDDVDYE